METISRRLALRALALAAAGGLTACDPNPSKPPKPKLPATSPGTTRAPDAASRRRR